MTETAIRTMRNLASMPSMKTTIEAADLHDMLLETDGFLFVRGLACYIKNKPLGAGVHQVWLEAQ